MKKLVLTLAAAGTLLAGCGSLTATTNGTAAGPATTPGGGSASLGAPIPAPASPTTVYRTTRTSSPTATPTVTRLSANAARQSLRDKVQRPDVAVVPVGAGYQGMAWDQQGHVTFWSYLDSTNWTQIGSSGYPNLPPPNQSNPDTAQAALLPHMTNAVFLLHGMYSGDGTGNVIAYTADGNGNWGAIKAETNGDIGPSGRPVDPNDNIGLEQAYYFVNGELETADCSNTLTSAQCGGDQRVFKFWSWTGTDFKLVRRAGLDH